MGARPRDSCRECFKTLNILPLPSNYILSPALFTVTNKSLFRLNYEIHILKQGITLIFPK
jgi:hypothetical protein